MSVTTVRLQPEIEESLESVATKLHRTKSWLINQALREYFERQSLEQQRWEQTLDAVAAVAGGKVVAAQAVHAWLQSWGSDSELPPPTVGR